MMTKKKNYCPKSQVPYGSYLIYNIINQEVLDQHCSNYAICAKYCFALGATNSQVNIQ